MGDGLMNDNDAFLRAIREDPHDPGRRLVYADWLEEHGDPKGEYLRVSCRLAELRGTIDPAWLAAVREGRFQVEEICLRSGRAVSLRALRQFRVYEGLLEGLPTTQLNQQIIDELLAQEREGPAGGEPYLIRPVETPLEYPRDRPYPFGQPRGLPPIACVGRFHSFQPAREPWRHYSELVVIWFQAEFALPIDPQVWEQFLSIDWDQHAADYDY
jgi:uncharacterized protein (TIGR02996 family)